MKGKSAPIRIGVSEYGSRAPARGAKAEQRSHDLQEAEERHMSD